MRQGDYYDVNLINIWFYNETQPKVCSLTPTRKKGVKLTQTQVKEFKVKLICTN